LKKFAFLLLLVFALEACKKEVHSVLDPRMAGLYIVSEICYTGPPPNHVPVVTTDSLRWTVALVGDSSVNMNGNKAKFIAVQQGGYVFEGTQTVSGAPFSLVFDSGFHTLRFIYNSSCDSCGDGCQGWGAK
jgi:hypothetical protein